MVKVSTLIYRVDGFNETYTLSAIPDVLNRGYGDQLLKELLGPLILDPGEKLVKTILEKI